MMGTTKGAKPNTRRNKMKITTAQYKQFIKDAIKTDGWQVTDIANKMALETKAITLDQYRMAARLIVDAYLMRGEEI